MAESPADLHKKAYTSQADRWSEQAMVCLSYISFFRRTFCAYIQKDRLSENLPHPTTVLMRIYILAFSTPPWLLFHHKICFSKYFLCFSYFTIDTSLKTDRFYRGLCQFYICIHRAIGYLKNFIYKNIFKFFYIGQKKRLIV